MTTIKTPAGEILALRVSSRFKNFVIESFPKSGIWLKETDSKGLNNWKTKLPSGNWQILGPISHNRNFGFDPEPFVEFNKEVYGIPSNNGSYPILTANDAFLNLIESQEEILWSNPIEKPEVGRDKKYDSHDTSGKSIAWHEAWHARRKLWQSYEAKRVKENELILIIVNR